ncbi:hypothetical protein GCM10011410_23190 [Hoyosella rhizosphaerae]|uniref:Uncharacterized protein n=1 Tax=Hoyosella rhizosphaerae TaxID=1755582 RepID=A0A916UES5_9ACTN|nr:hypothetical protein GCM10011410_23190 [Hoyosella rhizosphaerae]
MPCCPLINATRDDVTQIYHEVRTLLVQYAKHSLEDGHISVDVGDMRDVSHPGTGSNLYRMGSLSGVLDYKMWSA